MALVFLDCQWYCRQVYPGAKVSDDKKSFGCTEPSTSKNKMPAVGEAEKLEIVTAIQLAVLKAAGLKVTSVRGMGDKVEEALCVTETLDLNAAVNQAPCASESVQAFVDPSCAFFVTPHPARMYRQFNRVWHPSADI